MRKGTLYEGRPLAVSPFSFEIEVPTHVCESMTDGTLPTAIPAVVIDPPTGGAIRSLYDVLEAARPED